MTLADPAGFDLATVSRWSAAILDLPAFDGDGLALGRKLRRERESLEFLAIVSEERHGVDALRSGAFDYLAWPPREPASLWTLVGALLDRVGPPRRRASGTVGGFSLIRHLGAGGMADVFLAQRPGEAPLVVKCMRAEISENEGYVQMFMDEARVSQALLHPNIVRLVEFGGTESELYIAMEYVPGMNLAEIGKAAGWRLPPGIACFIAAEIAAALEYAHGCIDEKGAHVSLIHRDVNPPNVLVREDGAVKLADFGIAKTKQHHSQTTQGTVRGKLEYMSPEQVDGQPLDARTDVFSLGSVLYLLLTGEHPFQANSTLQTLRRIRQARCEPPSAVAPGVPAVLDAIVLRALMRDRGERYASAGALESDLRAWLSFNGNAGPTAVAEFVRDAVPGLAKGAVTVRPTHAVTVLAPPPGLSSEETVIRAPDPVEATITAVAGPGAEDERSTSSQSDAAENTVTAGAAAMGITENTAPFEPSTESTAEGPRRAESDDRPTAPRAQPVAASRAPLVPAPSARRVPDWVSGFDWKWAAGAMALIVLVSGIAATQGGGEPPMPVATPLRPMTARATATPSVRVTQRPAVTPTLVVSAATPAPTPRLVVATPVRPTPARKGSISIWVTDGWAAVSIDGRSLGINAPVVGLELSEGKHRITLENAPMKLRRDVDVTIVAGEEFRLNVSLR